jgi:hypothetical protein
LIGPLIAILRPIIPIPKSDFLKAGHLFLSTNSGKPKRIPRA